MFHLCTGFEGKRIQTKNKKSEDRRRWGNYMGEGYSYHKESLSLPLGTAN